MVKLWTKRRSQEKRNIFYHILIVVIAVSLSGCGRRPIVINMMTPEHIFQMLKGSTVTDPNGVKTEIEHNGWYYSDTTMEEIRLAEVK